MNQIERSRRFLLTGGPGGRNYGETPRNTRGFEPTTSSAFRAGLSGVGSYQQQLTNLDHSNPGNPEANRSLPGALGDIADWQARMEAQAAARARAKARPKASIASDSVETGVTQQLHDHQGLQLPIVGVLQGGKR